MAREKLTPLSAMLETMHYWHERVLAAPTAQTRELAETRMLAAAKLAAPYMHAPAVHDIEALKQAIEEIKASRLRVVK